jgi:WD40 repeat protein
LKYQLNQDILKNEKYPFSCIEKAHNNSIESLVAHPSGTFFASGSHDHLIKIWDAEKLQEKNSLTGHK